MSRIMPSRRVASAGVTALLLATAFVAVQVGPAAALAFTVTRFDDPTPDGCVSGVDCSLREAVIAANTNGGPDTITIPPGTYTLTQVGTDNNATAGDLDVTGPVTITGGGAGSTTIDGNGGVTATECSTSNPAPTPSRSRRSRSEAAPSRSPPGSSLREAACSCSPTRW